MKPVQVVLTIIFGISALSLTVWLGRHGGAVPIAPPHESAQKHDVSELPLPTSGPFGKAVASETTHDFGTLEKGASGSHIFVIKNEGEGPLRIKAGGTSCPQCTIQKISGEEEDIPPGKTVDVEISWNIKADQPKFRQTATIYTTDPENRKIELAIMGVVDTPLHLEPSGNWLLGDISGTEPAVAEGILYSSLVDEITVKSHECSNPLVTLTFTPASPEDLAAKEARSGLKVKVTVAPGVPVGPFRETVKLQTGVRDGVSFEFTLTGQRPGPFSLHGPGWVAQNNVLRIPDFNASEGTKVKLKLYMRDFDNELEAFQIAPERTKAKVRVANTGKVFGKSKVYDVDVEIPPGTSALHHLTDAEVVILKMNHPLVNEFKMTIDYYAR